MDKSEIIFGKNSVESLIETNSRKINKIFLAKGIKFDPKIRKIIDLARNTNITIQEVPRERLDVIAEGTHQGIAASVSPVEYTDFNLWLQNVKNNPNLSLVIILDGIEDPHNLGSIARSSVAAGADGIIIPARRSSQITAAVDKASAGTINKIPVMQVTNLTNIIEKLKENNFWIIGVESSGEKYYFDTDFNINCALVLGGKIRELVIWLKRIVIC